MYVRLFPEENIKFSGEVRMSADVIIYEYGSFFKITEKLGNLKKNLKKVFLGKAFFFNLPQFPALNSLSVINFHQTLES